VINKEEARSLLTDGLNSSSADETEILLIRGQDSLSRFANSQIHQSTVRQDDSLQVRAIVGKKIGIALTNQVTELKSTVEKACQAAKLATEKADFVSLPTEGALEADLAHYQENTAEFSPDQRAGYIAEIIKQAKDYKVAGMFETSAAAMAIANTGGIFSFQKQTEGNLNAIFSSVDEASYVFSVSDNVDEINAGELGRQAYEMAELCKNPVTLEPGSYTVILKPQAVAEMLSLLALAGFGALSFQENRSFMNTNIGKVIAAKDISICDDASNEKSLGWLFDYEGVKRQKVDFIKDGVANDVVYDSFTANRSGHKNTGHALPASSTYGPLPLNLVIEPGNSTVEELVGGTKRGLLINRFHYTNLENPIETIFTGMTRVGTFLIENGKTTKPITNMRFTQSILKALLEVEALTRQRTLAESLLGNMLVPALKIKSFNFSS